MVLCEGLVVCDCDSSEFLSSSFAHFSSPSRGFDVDIVCTDRSSAGLAAAAGLGAGAGGAGGAGGGGLKIRLFTE